MPPGAADAAERRQLTVMFSDLVGSTALSARLDPEDMRHVIRACQDAVSGVVARYDGFLAKFMGDGVLAYFGFPRAHEDDAARSVHAGLEIAEAVAALQTRARQTLAVRVGIGTGLVVVGDLVGQGSAPRIVMGPNIKQSFWTRMTAFLSHRAFHKQYRERDHKRQCGHHPKGVEISKRRGLLLAQVFELLPS